MKIQKITLTNFRNFKKLKIDNFKNVNLIIGKNGTGKTSIIESIYICSVGKSFRTNTDTSIARIGGDTYKIQLQIEENKKINKLEVLFNGIGKKNKYNYSLKKKLTDFIGKYKVLLFSPDEIIIIKGSPKSRREYFNIQISQIDKSYIKYLIDYNKLLKQRNEYLKNTNINYQYLDIIDDKLFELGSKIYKSRKDYIDLLNKKIGIVNKNIEFNNNIEINYISDLSEENIRKKIRDNISKDILYKNTRIGIHRDEIEILFNGKLAKDFASQGQQKMTLLIMKLAELKMFISDFKEKPILLLDDLFSELDVNNQNKLIDYLSKKTQVFMTTTDINNIKNKEKINIIDIDKYFPGNILKEVNDGRK